MTDNINPGIGTKIAILDDTPTTADAQGYEALTGWDEIGEVTEIGEFGAQHDVVTHTPLATGITAKYHGNKNYGSFSCQFARDVTDDGQDAAEDALESRARVSFRITYADGSVDFFQGKVFSFTRAVSIGAVVGGTIQIEIETPTVLVPAGS